MELSCTCTRCHVESGGVLTCRQSTDGYMYTTHPMRCIRTHVVCWICSCLYVVSLSNLCLLDWQAEAGTGGIQLVWHFHWLLPGPQQTSGCCSPLLGGRRCLLVPGGHCTSYPATKLLWSLPAGVSGWSGDYHVISLWCHTHMSYMYLHCSVFWKTFSRKGLLLWHNI